MRTIGIIGGVEPESTTLYYDTIIRSYRELKRDENYPEMVIVSLSCGPIVEADYRAPATVKAAIDRLAAARASFAIAASCSLHASYDQVAPQAAIPWVSVMSALSEAIRRQGIKKVGILGSRITLSAGFFQRSFAAQGIEVLNPSPAGGRLVNDVIYEELRKGEVKLDSRRQVIKLLDNFVGFGADGVVIASTWLSKLIRQEDTMNRLFDATQVYTAKALQLALSG